MNTQFVLNTLATPAVRVRELFTDESMLRERKRAVERADAFMSNFLGLLLFALITSATVAILSGTTPIERHVAGVVGISMLCVVTKYIIARLQCRVTIAPAFRPNTKCVTTSFQDILQVVLIGGVIFISLILLTF